ncbi:hypothetical protein CEQ90_14765 [Lewinellaceae bacterium SD302]|nr:hypothetical protein CEQ90_14765 [Lewinellaceae bacterium SD302]
MRHCLLLLSAILISATSLFGQSEIDFNLRVNIQQIQTVDPKILETLEKDLVQFLQGRAWTEDRFLPEERINCNIVMTLVEGESPNSFSADIAVQSSRPVYNSGVETAVFNTLDSKVDFFYEQFQAIQLSENSFTGNLASVLGYYVYLVLGFDYDTFSPLGGQRYFEMAQEIINRLPSDVADNSGWKATPTRNRFWLLENILSPRVLPLRRALYTYHREGLDRMYEDPNLARANISLALDDVRTTNQNYPNSQIVQAFVDAKREEIIEIFKGATPAEQNAVIQVMSQIDRANAGKYRDIRSRGGSGVRRPGTNTRTPSRAKSPSNGGFNRGGNGSTTTKGRNGK